MWTALWVITWPRHHCTMIYRLLVLPCSVVQNCQVDICQAVDGVAVRVFISQRSVQIGYALDSSISISCTVLHSTCSKFEQTKSSKSLRSTGVYIGNHWQQCQSKGRWKSLDQWPCSIRASRLAVNLRNVKTAFVNQLKKFLRNLSKC